MTPLRRKACMMYRNMKVRARHSRGTVSAAFLVVLAAIVLGPQPGAAASDPAASNSPSEVAKAKYELAARAYQGRRFGDAVLLLEESLRLHSSPNARLLLGHCYRDLGRLGSAHKTYQATEREAAERLGAGQQQYGEARKDAIGNLADLEPRVPFLTLAVPAGMPNDFTVLLDGLPVAQELWGTRQPLDPGKHEITASGTKQRKFSKTIELQLGGVLRVEVLPEREASAEVRLYIPDAPTGTQVFIDGKPSAANKEMTALYLDPGVHNLMVTAPGHRSVRWQRHLENGELVSLHPNLRRATPRAAALVLGGLTLATLVVAIGLGAQAQVEDDANRPAKGVVPDPSSEAIATRDRIRAMAGAATGLAPLAGVFGVATLGLALTADWSSQRAGRPRSSALTTSGGVGLMAGGEF